MTIELTKSEQAFVDACEVRPHDMTAMDLVAIIRKLQANAAPYLARIAELEAENARLRSVFVPPGSSLILIAPEAASQDEMHDTAKRAADVHDGPVIVMAHDWQSMSADELRTRINGATPPAQKHPKYERSWLSKQTDDKLADLYVDHVGFFDMNGMMLERENMIETLAAIIGDP